MRGGRHGDALAGMGRVAGQVRAGDFAYSKRMLIYPLKREVNVFYTCHAGLAQVRADFGTGLVEPAVARGVVESEVRAGGGLLTALQTEGPVASEDEAEEPPADAFAADVTLERAEIKVLMNGGSAKKSVGQQDEEEVLKTQHIRQFRVSETIQDCDKPIANKRYITRLRRKRRQPLRFIGISKPLEK